MQNKELARIFRFTSQLLELHDDNPFKVKSYANASFQIDKAEQQVYSLPAEDLEKIQGIGKSIAGKIVEIREQGTLADLEKMLSITPKGILDMLSIKGIGAKKGRDTLETTRY